MAEEIPFLAVDSIVKQFGGVRAVNGVTFNVRQHEILGLIGPNGAGKTTTFNLISGRFPLTAGEVRLEGKRTTGLRPDRIAALGIARTFQGTRIFPNLTVAENIETAQFSNQKVGFWEDWFGLAKAREVEAAVHRRSAEILEFIGLEQQKHTVAGSLAYAHQSLLGIGMALALNLSLIHI